MNNNTMVLPVDRFIDLLNYGEWMHVQSCSDLERDIQYNEDSNDYQVVIWGFASLESTLKLGRNGWIDISYQIMFSYQENNPDDTLTITKDAPNGGWFVWMKGVTIVDENHAPLTILAICDMIDQHAPDAFLEIDYSWTKNTMETKRV